MTEKPAEETKPSGPLPLGRSRLSALDGLSAGLLLLFALQAGAAAWRDSVTVDEFVHLPVGLHALQTGDLGLDPINPPFARMIAALPLLAVSPDFAPAPGTPHWALGYQFMERNPGGYHAYFFAGRIAIILVAVLLGLLVHRWTRELYGAGAACASLALFAFSPELLAHGHLVTLDLAGAAATTLAAYATWRFLSSPTPRGAALVGAAIGLASLVKLSGLVLAAAAALAVAVAMAVAVRASRWTQAPPVPWRRWAGLLALMGLAAAALINLGYGLDGSFGLLSDCRLDPQGQLAGLSQALPSIRLPLPRPFVEGADLVLNSGRAEEPTYYLLGRLSRDGWWYYHLVAFAAKTPLPALGLFLFALAAWAAGRSRGVREYCLVLPVVVIFASNALFNSLQIGVRHVLPALPLLIVLAGPWVARGLLAPRRAVALFTAGLLLWYAAGTLRVAPRYLQYFNEAAGGPEGGHRVLVDSNLDWGQDLIRLRDAMAELRIESADLAYFGRVDPRVYGVPYRPLEPASRSSYAVISPTFLVGRPYFWIEEGAMRWLPPRHFDWLRDREPKARVGSLFVFDLSSSP